VKNGQVSKKEDLLEVAKDIECDIRNALDGLGSAQDYLTQRLRNLRDVIELYEIGVVNDN